VFEAEASLGDMWSWYTIFACAVGRYRGETQLLGCDGSDTQGRMAAGYSSLPQQPPGLLWERLPEDASPMVEEKFDADLAQCMKPDYATTPAQFQRISAMGISPEDFIRVGDRLYRPKLQVIKGCIRVGRAEEGTSSLRPELAALHEALARLPVSQDALLLIGCQSVLTEIRKWIGEGCCPSFDHWQYILAIVIFCDPFCVIWIRSSPSGTHSPRSRGTEPCVLENSVVKRAFSKMEHTSKPGAS